MHNFVMIHLNMASLDMTYLKTIFSAFSLMVISSFKAVAGLPLPMAMSEGITLTEMREFFLKGDVILLIGFVLWIAYIVLFPPRNTLKRL